MVSCRASPFIIDRSTWNSTDPFRKVSPASSRSATAAPSAPRACRAIIPLPQKTVAGTLSAALPRFDTAAADGLGAFGSDQAEHGGHPSQVSAGVFADPLLIDILLARWYDRQQLAPSAERQHCFRPGTDVNERVLPYAPPTPCVMCGQHKRRPQSRAAAPSTRR